jgi:hypothetical protein
MALPQINTNPVDDRSEENIKTLHPEVQILARSLVHAADKLGITIKVIPVPAPMNSNMLSIFKAESRWRL